MIFWGLVLIAIGIGALLGISIWPLVFIVAGGVLLLSAVSGRRGRYRRWFRYDPRWREHFERRHQGEQTEERWH